MNASNAAMTSSPAVHNWRAFWERLWRSAGVQGLGLFVSGYIVYGYQPHVGASPNSLLAFYDGNSSRILISAVIFGLAVLNLMWFAAALRTTLAEAGQEGWGAAATASSSVVGAMFLLMIAMGAVLAYSVAASGNSTFLSGVNDFWWACVVLGSFPRAMLTMSSAFGLWRAGLISNRLFSAGVAAVVLTLMGGTTWLGSGIWAADGVYSRFVSPIIGIAWLLVVSQVLLARSAATRTGW